MYIPSRDELRSFLSELYAKEGRREIQPDVFNACRKKGWPTCFTLLKLMGLPSDARSWFKLQAEVMMESKTDTVELIRQMGKEIDNLKDEVRRIRLEEGKQADILFMTGEISGLRKAITLLQKQLHE